MARPAKEGLDYFPHDTDAVNDEKIEALRALHGNDGYAFFFILLERIYRSPNCELIVSDAETIQILARKVAVTEQKFNEMLITALKWGCFNKQAYENYGILTSNGIKKRASVVLEKRESMKEHYRKMKLKSSFLPVSDAETIPETIPETPQSKEKKSKEKKSKEKKRTTISAKNQALLDRFNTFWKAYPKKRAKGEAEKAFTKINPDKELLAVILKAIEQAKMTRQWLENNGEYTPHPATWLNRKGWKMNIRRVIMEHIGTPGKLRTLNQRNT